MRNLAVAYLLRKCAQRNAATAKYVWTQNTQNVLKRKIFNKINVVCAGKKR